MPKRLPVQEYIDGIRTGNRMVLGRAITLIESQLESDRELAEQVLVECMNKERDTFRLGITGVPGVGKSTFIDAFGMTLLERGEKVAVLAVDPSSQRTGGSILGDKTRMARLSREENAFIRPSPAGTTLGGVTRATRETMLLCEAAGYDWILVETVGVGQSEIAVHSMVDFFLLLMLAGAGDELQGIKKGIVEMAHGIVVNKADGDNVLPAKRAVREYQGALHLLTQNESGWSAPVLSCSAINQEGLREIVEMLLRYQLEMKDSGWWAKQRLEQARNWMHEAIRFGLEDKFKRNAAVQREMPGMEDRIRVGEIPPTVAAKQLIDLYLRDESRR